MAARQTSVNRKRGGTNTIDWAYWAARIGGPLTIAVLLALVAVSSKISEKNTAKTVSSPAGESAPRMFAPLSMMRRDLLLHSRRVYPYSVIPGGAESAQELRNALAHDAVASRHYQGFDVSKVRIIRLTQNREMYVSYRMGDRVYWTSKKIMIWKGEAILTDGQHEARTRCGNRLSNTPSKDISPKEPSAEDMEGLQDPPWLVRNAPPAPAGPGLFSESGPPLDAQLFAPAGPFTLPPAHPDWFPVPPLIYPIVGGGSLAPPLIPPSGPPPVTTPEPGTVLLLAAGLAVVAGFARFQGGQLKRRARTIAQPH